MGLAYIQKISANINTSEIQKYGRQYHQMVWLLLTLTDCMGP